MVDVDCPLCGMDEAEPVFVAADRLRLAEGGFVLVRCAHCGLVYLDPRPADEGLAGCYPRTYWGERHKGVREILRGVEERLKERYKLRAISRAGMTSGRVLDVGCGRGEFLAALRARGFEVMGLEPGEEAARRGREELGLDIVQGTLGSAGLREGHFDAATLWHVLEHLPDPLGALGELKRALRPGGLLFVAAPDFGGWQAEAFREDWFGVDAPRHLVHFTRETLSKMLEKAGFTMKAFRPAGARYETAMLVRSLLPGLNYRKLDALERGLPSRYAYKAAQLALDLGLLPAGFALSAAGRGCAFTAVAERRA